MDKDPRYWHTRGYIPHFDDIGFVQFITFRLADSVPQTVLKKWKAELSSGLITDAQWRRRVEYYLDQNFGSGSLKRPVIANLVKDALIELDGRKYRLIAWVIMPNHVHLLLEPIDGFPLPEIMHSIKSYTAHKANAHLNRTGHFWAKEYFDRYIRDSRHYWNTVNYIENNPVKARLCRVPEEWAYSSARSRKALT